MKPLPDECPTPVAPPGTSTEDWNHVMVGVNLRRFGCDRPPSLAGKGVNVSHRYGWDAQHELAREKGFA